MSFYHPVVLILTLAWYLAQFPEWTTQNQDNLLSTRHLAEGGQRGYIPNATCREEYNYKDPHACTPGVDCAFVVRWGEVKGSKEGTDGGGGEWVEFHVTASLSGLKRKMGDGGGSYSAVWVALGFSSNRNMGDTDVTACWYQDGKYSITTGYNTPNSHTFLPDTTDSSPTTDPSERSEVRDPAPTFERSESSEVVRMDYEATGIVDGLFHCKFSSRVDSGGLHDRVLYKKQFILAAVGPLEVVKDGQTKMLQHTAVAASMCMCDVTSCDKACSCPFGFFYQMLKLHGVVMSLCFMFLLPVGAIISRYYKAVFLNTWFKVHVGCMLIGVLWSLVGLGLVLTHTRGVFSVGVHQILGMLCLILAVVQIIGGFLRPDVRRWKWRKWFNLFHKSMAAAILSVISVVVLFWGVYLFHNGVLTYMFTTLSLYVLMNLGFLLLLEILKRKDKFSWSPPVGYHKVRRQDDLSGTEEEEEEVYVKGDKSSEIKGTPFKFEKGLLSLFIIQNLIFSCLISTFIFCFDAEAD